MEQCNDRLTSEQQKLVSDNHNLIYKYIIKNNIDEEEYYDILCIGLCRAAKVFDESKGRFSTIAFRCMENELNSYKRSQMKKSVIPEHLIISYDSTLQTYGEYDFSISELTNDDCIDDDMGFESAFVEFENKLSKNEKFIVSLLLNEVSQTNIAKMLGCKRQNVNYHMKKIREKAEMFLQY